MKIINVEERTLNYGTNEVIDLCKNEAGNTVVGEVYFQTVSAVGFSVQGTVDGTNYQAIKLFDLGNMIAISAATSAGVFMVNAAGYKAIKVVPGESVANSKLIIKTTF